MPPLFSRLSLPSSLEKREVSTHAVSRSVVKACSPSPSLLTTFSTSVLACRLSYSRRANQSAFRSNGPHDNYGCCHTHTRACTFSLYSCVCLFIEDFFRNERARKKKGKREALLFFFILDLIVLCFILKGYKYNLLGTIILINFFTSNSSLSFLPRTPITCNTDPPGPSSNS